MRSEGVWKVSWPWHSRTNGRARPGGSGSIIRENISRRKNIAPKMYRPLPVSKSIFVGFETGSAWKRPRFWVSATILTLLDAFDEILTLLGPLGPPKAVFCANHYRTRGLSGNRDLILYHGADFLYPQISARPGSGFYLHKEFGGSGSDLSTQRKISALRAPWVSKEKSWQINDIFKNFPALRAPIC